MKNLYRQFLYTEMFRTDINKIIKTTAIAAALLLTILSAGRFAAAAKPSADQLNLFRPSTGTFYSQTPEGAGSFTAIRWGLASDVLVPADYDGDGITDAAVWRPETGYWYIQPSGNGGTVYIKWGLTTIYPTGGLPDVPVPADYDGDGRADIAVWRPDTGEWFVLNSSQNYDQDKASVYRWGKLGDVPVQQDYDGDGRTDFAIFRSIERNWYIFESSTKNWRVHTFGLAGTDMLVPSDYTGDGKADVAVYRSGIWYVLNSETGETEPFQLGFTDAIAAPGDYDGDGQTDFAVFRKGVWYIHDSVAPQLRTINFGSDGDIPLNSLHAKASIVAVP